MGDGMSREGGGFLFEHVDRRRSVTGQSMVKGVMGRIKQFKTFTFLFIGIP